MSDIEAYQQVAVASGSDLAMSLDGSSSPVPSTQGSEPDVLGDSASSGSDTDDDTVLKVYVVTEDEEEKAIVFFDKYGNVSLSHNLHSLSSTL